MKPDTLPLGMVLLTGCRCRCGHEWLPRSKERPSRCAKCKDANWDRPKKGKPLAKELGHA